MADSGKRSGLPRACNYSSAFCKDWSRLSRSGRYDMLRLKSTVLRIVANDGPLGAEYRDHALKGEWSGFRECHVGGDFLLIYQVDDGVGKAGMVIFVRAGTHSELFRE